MLNKKHIDCDLCVIGGGMAGMCAAISGAREGLKVVLMHERPVLGGNASSEIRMWVCGADGRDNRETGILEEIALENLYRNPTKSYPVWDTVLYDFVKREKNINLLLNCTCMDACTEKSVYAHGREIKIKSVTGYQMTTQTMFEINARFYCDSSGDSILAPLCNADFRLGREAADEYGENTEVKVADRMTMGMSCLLQARETTRPVPYTAPDFATVISPEDAKNRTPMLNNDTENYWYLELGGNRDSIADTESIRDELLGLSTGMWDYIKNSGKYDADNWELEFLGFLPGKRESRRMCGEYIITQKDISESRVFEDEIAYGGWPLDDHFPGGFYHKGKPNTAFLTPAPYSLPYRALYSSNVDNLFFAGRNISMTHTAMSSIRVMATCALLGEAVGKAAYVACKYDVSPHGVYQNHMADVQTLLLNEDCFLPSKTRTISDICTRANLSADAPSIRNGQDRGHRMYGNNQESAAYKAQKGESLVYTFDKAKISDIHIVFCSDLNRDSFNMSQCEKRHSMRANQAIDAPVMHMPPTLCKSFTLTASANGRETLIAKTDTNRKRCYHYKVNDVYDTITLTVNENWGDTDIIPVISFDFR